jgi:hypothetical protein
MANSYLHGLYATTTDVGSISGSSGQGHKYIYGTFSVANYAPNAAAGGTVGTSYTDVYGVYAVARRQGNTTNYTNQNVYGIYASAQTDTGSAYAGYFSGNTYVSGSATTTNSLRAAQIGIGTNPSADNVLNVSGNTYLAGNVTMTVQTSRFLTLTFNQVLLIISVSTTLVILLNLMPRLAVVPTPLTSLS